MADLKLNTTNGSITLKPADGSGNVDVAIPRNGVGKILQVVETKRKSHLITSSTSYVDWITLSITPKSSTSKIRLTVSGGSSSSDVNNFSFLILERNGVSIAGGDAVGSSQPVWLDIGTKEADGAYYYQLRSINGIFIDEPNTTSTITYKARVKVDINGTLYLGRTQNISDNHRATIPSILVAEEIAN